MARAVLWTTCGLVLACGLLPARAATATSATEGTGWIEDTVDLKVQIVPQARKILVQGDATLHLGTGQSNGPTLWVNYGRYSKIPVMKFDSLTGPAGSRVTINDVAADHPGTFFATVNLQRPAQQGDRINISFAVESLRGNAFTLTINSPVTVVDESNGWYPQTLYPDVQLNADRERSLGQTTFLLPKGFHVVSNGELSASASTPDGQTETWSQRSPGLRSFAAGPYSVTRYRVGSTSLEMYTLAGTDPQPRVGDVTNVLRVLQAKYGAFPYERYSIAEVPDDEVSWYGLASRELTIERTSIFKRPDALGYFAHEAGHAWWGNLIAPAGPGGLMMNEGLAQYSAATVGRVVKGQASYLRALNFSTDSSRYSAQGYFTYFAGRSIDKPLSQLDISKQDDYDLAIAKGVWVYHMLRERVGDGQFFATLRSLIARFRGRAITLDDLRRAFVAAIPRAHLVQFFHDWLDQSGAPVLSWTAGSQGQVTIVQRQKQAVFHLLLPIEVHCRDLTFGQTVTLGSRTQIFRLKHHCRPTAVDLDPGSTLLIWRFVYGPVAPPNS